MLADPNARLANYTVTNTPGTLTITANSQTITFPALATAVTYGTGSVTLAATASSNLAITYTVLRPRHLDRHHPHLHRRGYRHRHCIAVR